MVYRRVGRLMQQGIERPWEQRPSTPRAQGTKKALTLASYREARAVKEMPPLDLPGWGVTASAQEAMVRQRGSRAELPHLSTLLSDSAVEPEGGVFRGLPLEAEQGG